MLFAVNQRYVSQFLRRIGSLLISLALIGGTANAQVPQPQPPVVPAAQLLKAVPSLTVPALKAALQPFQDALVDIAAHVTGDAHNVIAGLAQRLASSLNELSDIAGVRISEPLGNLGEDAQQIARTLASLAPELDSILNHQRSCLLFDSPVLIAAFSNMSLQLGDKIPLLAKGSPRVYYYQFVGHDQGIIPLSGGRMTLYGYRLWVDDPPDISIVERRSTKTFVPQRGASDDQVSIDVPESTLREAQGETILLKVVPHERKRIWFITIGTTTLKEVAVPVVVPSADQVIVTVVAHIDYKCGGSATTTLSEMEISDHNDDCGNSKGFTDSKNWEDQIKKLPSGSVVAVPHISDQSIRKGNIHNIGDGYQITHTDYTVTASGTFGSASCNIFGHRTSTRNLQVFVRPTAIYEDDKEIHNVATGAAVMTDFFSEPIDVLKACPMGFQPLQATTFWYTIESSTGNRPSVPLYTSPKTTVGDHGGSFGPTILPSGDISTSATFNPTAVANKASLNVTLTSPKCGK